MDTIISRHAVTKIGYHIIWWSKGCYYSTVGHISEETVLRYIESQKEQE